MEFIPLQKGEPIFLIILERVYYPFRLFDYEGLPTCKKCNSYLCLRLIYN